MSNGSSISSLIITMRNIYLNSSLNPLIKFTSSTRSTGFEDIDSWSISQRIMKTISISTKIVISYTMKQNILFWIWRKVNEDWDNNVIRISHGVKALVEQILGARRKKWSQKIGTVRFTVRDMTRKVNHLSKVIWDRTIIREFTRSIIWDRKIIRELTRSISFA